MRKVTVPEAGVSTLFGAYDDNLRQLESLLNVRIRTQGHELMALGTDADVEEGLELAQVVVVSPEQRGHASLGNRHLAHRRCAYSRISLRYKQLTANSHINTLLPVRSR